MEASVFVKRLLECVKHYRKTQSETADDSDLAHFYDSKMKKFLIENKKEIDDIFEMRSLLPFSKFVANYIWKK